MIIEFTEFIEFSLIIFLLSINILSSMSGLVMYFGVIHFKPLSLLSKLLASTDIYQN